MGKWRLDYGVMSQEASPGKADETWYPEPVLPAQITWEQSEPIAAEYGDIYFSRENGLEETRHVFLDGNKLPAAWGNKERFEIAELGFGTGLNFLATWNLWHQSDARNRLSYISFEKHPLTTDQLRKVFKSFPELLPLAEQLIELLPTAVTGIHRVLFKDPLLELTLVYGDAGDYLPRMDFVADAWFLDGFNPKKNPSLWSPEIYRAIGKKSKLGTTFATFSSARAVRDGLSQVGFSIRKVKGYGSKREMLIGEYTKSSRDIDQKRVYRRKITGSAVVIGGGLAGCSAAWSLARRGWKVKIIERAKQLAAGASGNQAAVLMPHISVRPDRLSRFCLAGYFFTQRQLNRLESIGQTVEGKRCGVLRLTTSKRLESLYTRLSEQCFPQDFVREIPEEQGVEVLGMRVLKDGLFFPQGGWFTPASLCRSLLAEFPEQISVQLDCQIEAIGRLSATEDASNTGVWQAVSQSGAVFEADILVLANGYETQSLLDLSWLPLEAVRGQVHLSQATKASKQLRAVICYDGFVVPDVLDRHFVGATYEHDNFSTEIDLGNCQQLNQKARQWVPDLDLGDSPVTEFRVAFRTMTPDRLPIIGEAPILAEFYQSYLRANEGKFGSKLPIDGKYSGLYLSLGHGSRGLISCPLAGEILACSVEGAQMPVDNELIDSLDPGRFLYRAVKRGLLTESGIISE